MNAFGYGTSRCAVVTGASSGVGRAVALALATRHWRVALVGRNRKGLEETVAQAGPHATRFRIEICDIQDAAAVARMADSVLRDWNEVDLLVNAAGTNVPERALSVLSLEDYRTILATNLDGAFHCVRAFLPAMRRQRRGTIVNIVSDAGKLASAKAGAAYVASKFGLAGLTQSINVEERANGIRACAIFPGDINTPLLDKRPNPPPPEARARMLHPEDVAACVLFCAEQPEHVIIEEILVRPR
ncbi:MAG: SDR family oxidoreductase [Verrucomicrobiota bacterium]|nr:SDR family oxidoreductase [Limisphaera sp.]MDW8380564.1 SDR family oxidoreductase [Verrucomicrobiota bacterium]